MDKVQHKREQELATVTEMIGIFCHDIHKTDVLGGGCTIIP